MLDDIYMVREGNDLVRMSCESYEDEPELQRLLADFPRLLAAPGGSDTPWLLVRREPGIPSEEGGSDRWALDHLFLDEEGMPTLVEVKRSSDTRLRRRVVGQMLDGSGGGCGRAEPTSNLRDELRRYRPGSWFSASCWGTEDPARQGRI